MKKKLALALAAVMMIGLFAGCGSKDNNSANSNAGSSAGSAAGSTSQGTATPASDMRVDVFYYDFSDIYISSVRASMDEQLKALGIEPNNWDGAGSQPTQTDQVNTAITAGSDLLIVNIVETSTSDPAKDIVEAARSADIPVIFFNREVADNEVINSYEKCAFVGTNAPDAGHMQGEMIGNYLVDNYDSVDLNGDGKISYAMFMGQLGNVEAIYRTQYGVEDANKVLEEKGKPALEYFDSSNTDCYQVDQDGNWSATAANNYMTTNLTQYNEENKNMIELVICNNDGMAEGAISALNDKGYNLGTDDCKTIPVFGVDATDAAKQLIKDGKMTGTIKQDAEGMAACIADLTKNAGSGQDVMAGTDSYNISENVKNKIYIPYAMYTGEE